MIKRLRITTGILIGTCVTYSHSRREVAIEKAAYDARKEKAEQDARDKRDNRRREEERRKLEEGRRILMERQRQRDEKEREKNRQLQADMRDYRVC